MPEQHVAISPQNGIFLHGKNRFPDGKVTEETACRKKPGTDVIATDGPVGGGSGNI